MESVFPKKYASRIRLRRSVPRLVDVSPALTPSSSRGDPSLASHVHSSPLRSSSFDPNSLSVDPHGGHEPTDVNTSLHSAFSSASQLDSSRSFLSSSSSSSMSTTHRSHQRPLQSLHESSVSKSAVVASPVKTEAQVVEDPLSSLSSSWPPSILRNHNQIIDRLAEERRKAEQSIKTSVEGEALWRGLRRARIVCEATRIFEEARRIQSSLDDIAQQTENLRFQYDRALALDSKSISDLCQRIRIAFAHSPDGDKTLLKRNWSSSSISSAPSSPDKRASSSISSTPSLEMALGESSSVTNHSSDVTRGKRKRTRNRNTSATKKRVKPSVEARVTRQHVNRTVASPCANESSSESENDKQDDDDLLTLSSTSFGQSDKSLRSRALDAIQMIVGEVHMETSSPRDTYCKILDRLFESLPSHITSSMLVSVGVESLKDGNSVGDRIMVNSTWDADQFVSDIDGFAGTIPESPLSKLVLEREKVLNDLLDLCRRLNSVALTIDSDFKHLLKQSEEVIQAASSRLTQPAYSESAVQADVGSGCIISMESDQRKDIAGGSKSLSLPLSWNVKDEDIDRRRIDSRNLSSPIPFLLRVEADRSEPNSPSALSQNSESDPLRLPSPRMPLESPADRILECIVLEWKEKHDSLTSEAANSNGNASTQFSVPLHSLLSTWQSLEERELVSVRYRRLLEHEMARLSLNAVNRAQALVERVHLRVFNIREAYSTVLRLICSRNALLKIRRDWKLLPSFATSTEVSRVLSPASIRSQDTESVRREEGELHEALRHCADLSLEFSELATLVELICPEFSLPFEIEEPFSLHHRRLLRFEYDYETVSRIGTHDVFLRRHIWSGAEVVHKEFDCVNESYGLTAFRTELSALDQLDHSNIVHLLGFFRYHDCDRWVIELEYLGSQTFEDFLCSHPQFELVLHVFERVAHALQHVHSKGLTHSDVKLSNIMVVNGSHPVLVDFKFAMRPKTAKSASSLRSLRSGNGREHPTSLRSSSANSENTSTDLTSSEPSLFPVPRRQTVPSSQYVAPERLLSEDSSFYENEIDGRSTNLSNLSSTSNGGNADRFHGASDIYSLGVSLLLALHILKLSGHSEGGPDSSTLSQSVVDVEKYAPVIDSSTKSVLWDSSICDAFPSFSIQLRSLLEDMLAYDWKRRPTAAQLCRHPLFVSGGSAPFALPIGMSSLVSLDRMKQFTSNVLDVFHEFLDIRRRERHIPVDSRNRSLWIRLQLHRETLVDDVIEQLGPHMEKPDFLLRPLNVQFRSQENRRPEAGIDVLGVRLEAYTQFFEALASDTRFFSSPSGGKALPLGILEIEVLDEEPLLDEIRGLPNRDMLNVIDEYDSPQSETSSEEERVSLSSCDGNIPESENLQPRRLRSHARRHTADRSRSCEESADEESEGSVEEVSDSGRSITLRRHVTTQQEKRSYPLRSSGISLPLNAEHPSSVSQSQGSSRQFKHRTGSKIPLEPSSSIQNTPKSKRSSSSASSRAKKSGCKQKKKSSRSRKETSNTSKHHTSEQNEEVLRVSSFDPSTRRDLSLQAAQRAHLHVMHTLGATLAKCVADGGAVPRGLFAPTLFDMMQASVLSWERKSRQKSKHVNSSTSISDDEDGRQDQNVSDSETNEMGSRFMALSSLPRRMLELRLEDLEEFDPIMAHSLSRFHASEMGDDFTFEGIEPQFLPPGILETTVVTPLNQSKFIAAQVHQVLLGKGRYDSMRAVCDAFAYCLRGHIPSSMLQLMGSREWRALLLAEDVVSAAPIIEIFEFDPLFDDRESCARQSLCHIPSALPEVLIEWEKEGKTKNLSDFLLFVCSSPSVRVCARVGRGRLFIKRVTTDPSSLPSSSTCFATLNLPNSYPNQEHLRSKLEIALQFVTGFGKQ